MLFLAVTVLKKKEGCICPGISEPEDTESIQVERICTLPLVGPVPGETAEQVTVTVDRPLWNKPGRSPQFQDRALGRVYTWHYTWHCLTTALRFLDIGSSMQRQTHPMFQVSVVKVGEQGVPPILKWKFTGLMGQTVLIY